MAELRIGFIGCGEIAVAHARAIEEASNARLVACMDVVESVAKDLGEKYSAKWTTDPEEVLSEPEVDAVYIATPHYLHCHYSTRSARKGKHIMCEKPIATTLHDADQMISVANECGVKLSVCFAMRFEVWVQEARRLVNAGAIGEPIAVFLSTLTQKPQTYWQAGHSGRVKTDWRTSREKSGGGILIMNLSHDIDYALSYILELKPKRIFSQYGTFATDAEVEDLISVCGRLENGAILQIEGSSCAWGGKGNPSRIIGTRGQLILDNPLQLYITHEFENFKRNEWNEIKLEQDKPCRTLYVESFARAVLDGGEVPASGEEARRALEVVLSAYESGESNSVVEFE